MDSKRKAKWVEALRSGKYRQGRGTLRDDKGNYCCLGVLCEIEGVPRTRLISGISEYHFDSCNNAASIPSSYENLGVEKYKLMDMNDRHRKTFSEIADYIEEKL